jgi:tRNA(Met) cytidine acetyltransferase
MLDDDSVSIHIIEQNGQVIATTLSTTEGGFDATLAQEIYAGKRRPKGHLIPQSLAFHAGVKQAATLTGERIIRIAVHENCQRKGLATQLIQAIYKQSKDKDYIGASFSATSDMLHFWEAQGFTPVRLGLKRDASSGTHSVIQLLPISPQGKLVFQQLRERFQQSFLHMLSEPLCSLEANIVSPLLRNKQAQAIDLKGWEWEELHAFANTNRGYEVCISSLWNWLRQFIQQNDFKGLKQSEQTMLISKILQKKTWQELSTDLEFTGKKNAIKFLRKCVLYGLSK